MCSLLPKYRGAAPVQWAVLNGDKETGVTIMQLDEGLDTGDILTVCPVPIDPEETSGQLFERITRTGAETLLRCIGQIEAGEARPRPQGDARATQAPPLTKEMARLDFALPAAQLHNWVRGMNPWPMAWFECGGKRVKVVKSRLAEGEGAPGQILSADPLIVACGQGALELDEVVPEGKKPMTGAAWAAGPPAQGGGQPAVTPIRTTREREAKRDGPGTVYRSQGADAAGSREATPTWCWMRP